MKRAIALMAASLLASAAAISSPVFADNGGGGHGKGGEHGASDNGRGEGKGSEARANAPGQMKGDGESAKRYAPGQQMADDDDQIAEDDDDNLDETETASIRSPNFGALISAIRSGNVDLSGVESSTDVNVVEIDDLLKGNNRSALDNALADNEEQISQLRTDLGELDVEGLSDDQINGAVAARTEADGSLTVYVE